MKNVFLSGTLFGVMMLAQNGMANATSMTFDFESGGVGTQSTGGFASYGFGNLFLWSAGNVISQEYTQLDDGTIDLSFNLAIISSWDGNSPS